MAAAPELLRTLLHCNDLMTQEDFNRDNVTVKPVTLIRYFLDHRLPTMVLPRHYELELKPNFELFSFKGKTTIEILIKADTDIIILNAVDIDIFKAELTWTCNVITPKKISYSVAKETVALFFESVLPAGLVCSLVIDYVGKLNEETRGFFRSKYMTASGQEKYAVLTHFEASNARRCFPCWDEPAIKATFDIHLIVPMNYVALSNMPIFFTERVGRGNHRVSFLRTPKMSTYLVAIVVGEYEQLICKSQIGDMVRIFLPFGKKVHSSFAMEVAVKSLIYFKTYFNMDYPLPKIDLVAIDDFPAGAMANWGLVICHDTFVLFDPKHTPLHCKQKIALTIAHMICQQWFGSLVSLEWWTYFWLNEGLPDYCKYECVDKLFPEFNIWTQFIADVYSRATILDALPSSHPIQVVVKNPSMIEEIFDELSCTKSACVIRMLQSYIGELYFCKGLNLYLNRHEHKNTHTLDLWATLQQVSSKPIAEIMLLWARFEGLPVVSVSVLSTERKRLLTLKQKRFTTNGTETAEENIWKIPISLSISRNPRKIWKTFLLDQKEMEIEFDDIGEDDWIKLNPGSVGYYRTKYSAQMLADLMPAVESMQLPPFDRLSLIDDMFAMMQAGQASTAEVLQLIELYQNESKYLIWTAITNAMSSIHVLVSHTNLMENFELYGQQLYTPIAESLGWEERTDESHEDKLLRRQVLLNLITFRSKNYVLPAQKLLHSIVDSSQQLAVEMRFICFKALLQDASDETYNRMLSIYRSTVVEENRELIENALGCMSNQTLLGLLLKTAMSGEFTGERFVRVIVGVALNPKGRDLAWRFFKDNSNGIMEHCQRDELFAEIVKNLIENFATEAQAQDVELYFKLHRFEGLGNVISKALEKIHLNIAWLKRDFDTLSQFLRKYQKKNDGAKKMALGLSGSIASMQSF